MILYPHGIFFSQNQFSLFISSIPPLQQQKVYLTHEVKNLQCYLDKFFTFTTDSSGIATNIIFCFFQTFYTSLEGLLSCFFYFTVLFLCLVRLSFCVCYVFFCFTPCVLCIVVLFYTCFIHSFLDCFIYCALCFCFILNHFMFTHWPQIIWKSQATLFYFRNPLEKGF